MVGFVPSFAALIALAALSGLGSGLYHPLGALNARAVIDERERHTALSLYVTAGKTLYKLRTDIPGLPR